MCRASSGCSSVTSAFVFLFRNLAKNIFGEMMLKLAERSHPIVDPIEQDQDDNPGKSAAAKTDKQALDQSRADGNRAVSPFP